MSRYLRPSVASCALLVVALGGCSAAKPTNAIRGRVLTIYAGMPLQGASDVQALAVTQGAELALAGNRARIGQYRIRFRVLDDAIATKGVWDPGQTTINAHLAANDRTTIAYLGDLNSGASAVSIPILNRAGIAQVSPSNTAVGLTSLARGSAPGEPQKYYPTGERTYARVVPNDVVQSAVQVTLQQREGCTSTYVVQDDDVDGEEFATSFEIDAKSRGLAIAGAQSYEPGGTDYTGLASTVAKSGANCVLISAITAHSAIPLTTEIAAALPKAKIFGPDGVAESSYTDPALGGVPLAVDPRIWITVATLPPGDYPPAGRAFFAAYNAKFGAPEPYAIFGYEAMSLLLDAIRRATDGGRTVATRSHVVAAIFATRERQSVLGTYSIDADGDTTLKAYGAYRVIDGHLRFWDKIVG